MAKRSESTSKPKTTSAKTSRGSKKTAASKAKSVSAPAKKRAPKKAAQGGGKGAAKPKAPAKKPKAAAAERPAAPAVDPAVQMGLVEPPEEKLPPVKIAKRDLAAIEKALEGLYQRLTQDVGALTQNNLSHSGRDMSGDLSGYGFHMADVATDNFAREMELNIATGETDRLRLIEEAFDRIGEGTFGRCVACKEPIGVPRLKVIPYARLCIRCAEEAERR